MFSIIVPVHNVEQYIEKCINSILSQTGFDFELVIVENASTDKSLEICQKFAKKDSRINLIVADKAGVSNARNLGIENAAGEWLVFVDADDYILPNCLAVLHKAISENKECDFVVANYTQSDIPKELSNSMSVISSTAYGKAMLDTPKYFEAMKSGLTWAPGMLGVNWAKAFRKSVIVEKSVLFNTEITIFEDLLFNLEFIKHIDKIACIDTPVYYYRVAEGSLSRNNSAKRVTQRIDYLKCLLDEDIPQGLEAAKRFHIGQGLLRTYVVSARCIKGNRDIRSEIINFINEKRVQNILQELRSDELSNGKIQKKFYSILLHLLKKRMYGLATCACFVYAKFKHKT